MDAFKVVLMSTHYVYVHKRATDGTIFYVGQGRKRRAWSTSGRNTHWHRIVAKYGYEIELIITGLRPECALSMERATIAFYGRGNLCNLTDGGDIGPTGLKHSEETKKAHSERLHGNTHTLGRKLTDEHRAAISAKLRDRPVSEETRAKLRNRPVTEETRAKLSAASKGRVMSQEWIERNAAARRGRKLTEEHKNKLREAGFWQGRTGKDNPSYGIPKTPEQKAILSAAMKGRKFSAETLTKRSGENHPRYDGGTYTLYHSEYGTVTAERHYFMDTFGIDSSKFTAVVKGKRKSSRGWSLPS